MPTTSGPIEPASLVVPRADAPDESGGSGAEGRARKRVQRAANSTQAALSRSGTSVPAAARNVSSDHGRPPFHTRRRSTLRKGEHKTPLGPRPLDNANTTRRIPSDSSTGNSTNNSSRSFLPTATSEPNFTQPPRTNNPRFSFSKQSDSSKDRSESSGSFDFLPSINFDDFHTSITAPFEPELSDFPAPGGGGGGAGGGILSSIHAPRTSSKTGSVRSISGEQSDTSEQGRGKYLNRRVSAAPRQTSGSKAQDPTSMPPPNAPTGPLSVRTRRQSQFPPPAPSNPAARPPRKSVGPGLLTTQQSIHAADSGIHGHQGNIAESQPRLGRTVSNGKSSRPSFLNRGAPDAQPLRLSTAPRSLKSKSLQPPPRQASNPISSSENPADQSGSLKSPTQKNGTPGSAGSKRQSMMPSHASGLGARTISPTDAMRMKRMSMMPQIPNPPPLPQSPPTNHVEPNSPADQSEIRSPSFPPPRKDSAPISARDTPDAGRKSIGPGQVLSHSSSYGSLKTGSSNPNRSSQNLSGSRLPTPKPRSLHSAQQNYETQSYGGEEEEGEEVPPVPAIPKAFESPKDTMSSWLPPRKSSQPNDNQAQDAEPASPNVSNEAPVVDAEKNGEQQKQKASQRQKRGNTVGASTHGSERQSTAPNVARQTLQPLRLPPLNLLPLSTPTNSRIAQFPAPSDEVDHRAQTPPKRITAKTPSTPMTASKASFFKGHKDEDGVQKAPPRSSSSHYALRSDITSNFTLPSQATKSVPVSKDGTRHTTTPFSSNSLPKSGGDFGHFRSRRSVDIKTDTDGEGYISRVLGPRAQAVKKDTSSNHTSTSDEQPETPTSGNSLRRKLSLGWKRSSSKASVSHPQPAKDGADEHPPQPPKHGEMPPPKLPASATWNHSIPSPSPSNKSRGSLDFRRRKPSASAVMSDTEADLRVSSKRPMGTQTTVEAIKKEPANSSRSSSAMTPVQRFLTPKSSTAALKARNLDTNLDKEDRAADEEMKRLTSKRKDFEGAAKEVDELRKRARPNERVSPTQALQLVTLNIFERGEIIDYKEVYFCGTKSAKKHVGDLNSTSANFGYDDERGDYNIVLGDHLAYRYEVVDLLGKGSFGQVVRCVDHKTGGLVAIKIIRNKKRFHQQALVEVNILQKLQDWDPGHKHSMIKFTESFYFRGHLCISTELLGMNLYELIKAYEFRGFSVRLIRRFTRQMLASLVLLQKKRVIHCDLKPENILLAHPLHSEIKVIDFGSSCFENEKVYTYIQSRFYRSPEVILGMSYGIPIDMWSLGCILAELLTGYPIFPGENEQEQLACIMEIFGPPEKHLIEKSSRKKLFFDSLGKPRVTVSSKGRRRRPSSKTLQQALKCDDEAFLDFISRCLRWDPERRLKPDEALHHEFVTATKKPPMSKFGPGTSRPPRTQANGLSTGPTAVTGGSAASSSAGTSSNAPSPMKRGTGGSSLQTPQRGTGPGGSRPLPEPPATSFRNGTAVRDGNSVSPIKGGAGAPPRRHSTVHGAGGGVAGMKRASNGLAIAATPGSSLPRAAGPGQRSTSGKADLASAAAAASLVGGGQ